MGTGSAAWVPGVPTGAPRRLAIALCGSLLLHAWLTWGVAVRPPRVPPGEGGAGLQARIVVAQRPDRDFVAEPRPRRAPAPVSAAVPAPAAAPSPPAPPASGDPAPPAPPAEPPALVELPLPGQLDFFPARMLDVMPRPVDEVPLQYPESAGDESGTVTLLLLIDELGMVVEASVVEADPPGVFDLAALEAFRGTLFVPGQRHGRPVRSRLVLEVSFHANADSKRLR